MMTQLKRRAAASLISAVVLVAVLGCVPTQNAQSLASVPARAECFMIVSLDSSVKYVSDEAECSVKTAPASTFKIPHSLIALQTGVLSSPSEIISWDGSRQPFATWEQDQTLDSAMKGSVVWYFRRIAAQIGRERMADWLSRIGYAADTFDGDPTLFWLNGELVVSPLEQLNFLQRLYRNEIPIESGHFDAVKSALLMPYGTLLNASGAHSFILSWGQPVVIGAKTGNTRVGDESASWLVGYIQGGGREYVFASRVRSKEQLPGTAGSDLALRVLNSIGPDASRNFR